MDLGMAAHTGGRCFLRFDDTNPEAEKQEYIDHIQEIIAWLGYTPWKARSIRTQKPPLSMTPAKTCRPLALPMPGLHNGEPVCAVRPCVSRCRGVFDESSIYIGVGALCTCTWPPTRTHARDQLALMRLLHLCIERPTWG